MANWLRIVLTLVVRAHGLGHLLFLIPLLGITDWAQATHSWLLGDGWFWFRSSFSVGRLQCD